MANPKYAQRPTDPLELMKRQGDSGKVAGTPLTQPSDAPDESAAEVSADVVAEAMEAAMLPPVPPPPPPQTTEVYLVLEDKIVTVRNGRHATTMRKGMKVFSDQHDLVSLRTQGLKMERIISA